jgi:hypothetical protein
MHLSQFYERTLPHAGSYALFRTSTLKHTWCESIEELADATAALGDRPDIYFATASFGAQGSRSQANVEGKRCFYLDLDAGAAKLAKHGPETIYETQQDAIAGVISFVRGTGLKPSLVVSSGEGLHLYWCLGDAVGHEQWTAVAKQFQKFGVAHGLKIDSAVTADSARILRPIGTKHPNGNTVKILSSSDKVYTLGEFAAAVGVVATPKASMYDMSINDDIKSNVQGPPKLLKKVLSHCSAANYGAANQDSLPEPYWRLMIGLAKHTVDGLKNAHLLSCRHPDYDEAETERKFNLWATGPSTCAKFEEFRPSACAKCVHKGKIKSPVQLGAANVEEVAALPEAQRPQVPEPAASGDLWDGAIPKGFEVLQHKGALTLVHYMDVEKENELGEKVPVRVTVPFTNEIFWLGHWADAEHATDTAQVTLFRLDQTARVSTFTMDQSLVASRAELAKYMASKGIHTTTHKNALTSMEHYVKAGLQRIKALNRRIKVSDHMGLRNLPDGTLVSTHGQYVIHPDGRISTAILSPALQSYSDFYPCPLPPNSLGEWGPEVWGTHIFPEARRYLDFIKRKYAQPGMERFQLAIMLGLASPLMVFSDKPFLTGTNLPPGGLSVSLFSKATGRGKSAAMDAAMLAYGRPDGLRKDQNEQSATALARIAKLSVAGTMPSCMDEMGSTNEKATAALVSAIANGAARERLDKTGALVQSSPWALICLLATNKSQRDMITGAEDDTSAIQYRLLEINCETMPEYSGDDRTEYSNAFAEVADTAGAFGAIIQLIICKRGAKWMGDFVRSKVHAASKIVTLDSQNARFQYRGLGAVLALQELLTMAKLDLFDPRGYTEEFRIAHDSGRQYVEDNVSSNEATEVLSRCLFALAPHTVITTDETRRSGRSVEFDPALNRVPEVVKARHVVASGVTYVSAEALREWCLANKVRMGELVYAAVQNGIIRRVRPSSAGAGALARKTWPDKFNLLKGMRESTSAFITCYAFSATSLAEAVGGDYHQELISVLKGKPVATLHIESAA